MNKHLQKAFTVVELIIVIVVIGILASISVSAYGGMQQRAYDVGILSDADAMNTAQTSAGVGSAGVSQDYSSVASDEDVAQMNKDLDFYPTKGNIVDVKATSDGKEFCIRVYNPKSRVYNSAFNAYQISSSKSVDNGEGSCSYNTPPTVYSGGAIPGAYETIYTSNDTYAWPANATRVEVAVIGAGGKGAIACGGGGGGVSTAVISSSGTYPITVGAGVSGAGAQAGSSSFGSVTATGGQNATNYCTSAPSGGTGTTTGGVSQKYGAGDNGGRGGYYFLGLLQLATSGVNATGGGGAGGKNSLVAGGDGGNGTYGGGGGGGGPRGLLGIGCYGPGTGGNPGGQTGNTCDNTSGAGNGGTGNAGGGGGGASDVNSSAVGGDGGSGLVRVLTCFDATCNPEATPIP